MSELGYRRIPERPTPGSPVWAVMRNEWHLAFRSFWGRLAMIGLLAFAVMYVGSLYQLEQAGRAPHTWTNYLAFLDNLRWGGLVLAAVMAGPGLLEDARTGGLELYLASPLTRRGYLTAKTMAALLMVSAALWLPALVYYGISFFLFEESPDKWLWSPLSSLAYVLMWSIPITGAGFAISCLARSGRAAALWLFGGVFILDVLITNLLSGITRTEALKVLSPLAMHAQQTDWLFREAAPYDFEPWWGIVGLVLLTVVGWTITALRYPRLRGGEARGD